MNNKEIEQFLIDNNSWISRKVAGIYNYGQDNNLEYGDYYNEAYIVIHKLLSKNYNKNLSAANTYVTRYLKPILSRFIQKNYGKARIPVYLFEEIRKLAASDITDTVSEDELVSKLGISNSRAKYLIAALNVIKTTSIEAMSNFDLECNYKRNPEYICDLELNKKIIQKALDRVGERGKKIITLYYGLDNNEPMNLKEIGKVFGLSQERINQIRHKSEEKLRRYLLEDYKGGTFND